MSAKLTVRQFFERFPNDQACLDHVMDVRYGHRHTCHACKNEATFHKITGRKAYSCSVCGDHVYPCARTIFEDSRTSLQLWFYAIYLFVVTRHGVSGKKLQRGLGVTYKTAWRMGHQIRTLMTTADGFEMLRGHVESDESYVGGRRKGPPGRGALGKTIVMGIKQRGGKMHAEVIPNVKLDTLRNVLLKTVQKGAIVSTDELISYDLLSRDGYTHGTVKHGIKEYAYYDWQHGVMHHTNHVESFWRLFKKSVASTHIHVSPKYMNRYLSEFTFRSNHREMKNAMFDLLIGAI
jgi:transposase